MHKNMLSKSQSSFKEFRNVNKINQRNQILEEELKESKE